MNYRNLTEEEITILKQNGCSSENWSSISVAEDFSPENICNARISNCEIGSNVVIRNVFGELCNLSIQHGVCIEAVYSITCDRKANCGVGHRVDVLSETGGRPVIIYPGMSAQIAYFQAFYRHKALLSKQLEDNLMAVISEVKERRGVIGSNARIVNCGIIKDAIIEGGAHLEGVSKLVNCTIGKAEVGPDVIAEDAIILDGATVTDGSHLKGVFVGEAVTLSAATVHDSLIFANSHIENGEVAASFLGPFSTSMHKSSLLIGGLFSFFNAGSGSNQSNHAYKLGPMHHGVTQRGCKTGSDSYILWPAAIGAFSTILGRHYTHPDTRDFPFSILLNDKEGRSVVLPGAAATTVGFARDIDKWPKRDGRESDFDIIDFHWLSPFTVEASLRALKRLEEGSIADGFVIPERAVEKGKRIYRLLIDRYVAETILQKIQSSISVNPQFGAEEIVAQLQVSAGDMGHGHWVDAAGMLAPKALVGELIDKFVGGQIRIENLDKLMVEDIYRNYTRLNWSWLQQNIEKLTGLTLQELTPAKIAKILTCGAVAVEELTRMWEADAAKEFDPQRASVGFGIDAYENKEEILDDFARARGSLAGNQFLAMNQRTTKIMASRMRMFAQVMEQAI